MRFNDRELVEISLGDAELEGRLNHRRPLGGNFGQKGNIDMALFFLHFMCLGVLSSESIQFGIVPLSHCLQMTIQLCNFQR
jgi:hypothetical protein